MPKNLEFDSINKPESQILQKELNTISSIQLFSRFREDFKLTENDNQWLDNTIEQIATALFLDGKRILVSAVGGYSGCPDKMIDTLCLNDIEIINLKFCHTCTEVSQDEKFIRIFNDKMYSLMKIEPPNGKTNLFYGEYEGKNKERFEIKLIINEDRTFRFWVYKGHSSDFTEGLWKNNDNTLILQSRNLNEDDKLIFTLSSGKWIEFNNLEFRLREGKLTELGGESRKLKKKTE